MRAGATRAIVLSPRELRVFHAAPRRSPGNDVFYRCRVVRHALVLVAGLHQKIHCTNHTTPRPAVCRRSPRMRRRCARRAQPNAAARYLPRSAVSAEPAAVATRRQSSRALRTTTAAYRPRLRTYARESTTNRAAEPPLQRRRFDSATTLRRWRARPHWAHLHLRREFAVAAAAAAALLQL